MKRLNFFTWNVKNNHNQSFYEQLNKQLVSDNIDILILQECSEDTHISELKEYQEINYFENGSGVRRVRLFIRISSNIKYDSPTAYNSNYLRCTKIIFENRFVFNLMGVHLKSAVGITKAQQLLDNENIPKYIFEFEELAKNDKSIIIGDFNYKPFEVDLIHPRFLNTCDNRGIIETFSHIRNFKQGDSSHFKRYFYNPMWNLLGDYDYKKKALRVTGTYYWYPKDVEHFHWNLIDGLILSPSLMNHLILESLEIVTSLDNIALVKNRLITNDETESLLVEGFSDHLPIKFSIKTI